MPLGPGRANKGTRVITLRQINLLPTEATITLLRRSTPFYLLALITLSPRNLARLARKACPIPTATLKPLARPLAN